jgi:hypothetical protein
MELVGTWRYDVLHTVTFQQRLNDAGRLEPSIVDLLTLAILSAQWDHTREGYPSTLFLALKTLFNGVIASHRNALPLPADISHLKGAVIDAFDTRRQCMQEEIDLRNGYRDYVCGIRMIALNTRLSFSCLNLDRCNPDIAASSSERRAFGANGAFAGRGVSPQAGGLIASQSLRGCQRNHL